MQEDMQQPPGQEEAGPLVSPQTERRETTGMRRKHLLWAVCLVLLLAGGAVVYLGVIATGRGTSEPSLANPFLLPSGGRNGASSRPHQRSDQPAFDQQGHFTPDVQRAADLASLQVSLERHRVEFGHYPSGLTDLFPNFAPVQAGKTLSAVPGDPISHISYGYLVHPDGLGYKLSATLSTGETLVRSNSDY